MKFRDKYRNPDAFPHHQTEGMSLRDYFAGQALAGIPITLTEYGKAQAAVTAYEIADLMLMERIKDA